MSHHCSDTLSADKSAVTPLLLTVHKQRVQRGEAHAAHMGVSPTGVHQI